MLRSRTLLPPAPDGLPGNPCSKRGSAWSRDSGPANEDGRPRPPCRSPHRSPPSREVGESRQELPAREPLPTRGRSSSLIPCRSPLYGQVHFPRPIRSKSIDRLFKQPLVGTAVLGLLPQLPRYLGNPFSPPPVLFLLANSIDENMMISVQIISNAIELSVAPLTPIPNLLLHALAEPIRCPAETAPKSLNRFLAIDYEVVLLVRIFFSSPIIIKPVN